MTGRSFGKVGKPQPVLCMDVGGSFIKFGVSATPGALSLLDRIATPTADWDAFMAAIADVVQRHAAEGAPAAPLALSIAGLVDPRDGVATSANIPCITGRRVAEDLAKKLGRPVFAANDADCLTLAEANAGAGVEHSVVFCAVMGTGIGGGLAIDGHLVRGAGGVTGEWGHGPILNTAVQVDQQILHIPRFACGCGQSGCVDTVGGARGIERLHGFLHGRNETSHDILQAWQVGQAKAGLTVAAYLELIADPLALVANLTGASIVPVGGGLGSVPALIDALDHAVRARILNRFDRPLVVPAIRQDDGGLVGAAILGHQSLRMAEDR